MEKENSQLNLNLYDLNQSIMSQLKPLTENELNKKIALIENFHNCNISNHYMLLCKEYNYYTLFEDDPTISLPTFSGAVFKILSELGDILSLDLTEDKQALEIWIRLNPLENKVFYLFPYDKGVVYYG